MALSIGFSFWWSYFDLIGHREPEPGQTRRAIWNFAHLPMWLSVAAGGAGMVSLIEHATDSRTPANTAWLLAGATAGITFSLAALSTTMAPHPARRIVPYNLCLAGAVVLGIGALRPRPILLAAGLFAALSAVWFEAFIRHARAGTAIDL